MITFSGWFIFGVVAMSGYFAYEEIVWKLGEKERKRKWEEFKQTWVE